MLGIVVEEAGRDRLISTPSEQFGGRLLTCRVDELRPHIGFLRHHLFMPTAKLSALAQVGDAAFQEPLVITCDRTIIDGYARWELARLQGRTTVACIEYDLTEEEALRWLLHRHRRSKGLNDFCRILLARELEPLLKKKALANQQYGGQAKGSSKLTEAEKLDVRREIAAAAGVCVASVTKVKQLTITAAQELLQALSTGEVSIHRAWGWSKHSPDSQLRQLRLYRDRRGASMVKKLILRHRPKNVATPLDPPGVLKRLAELESSELADINVAVVKSSGKAIFLTEDLLRSLSPYQEPMPI